jgi:hypothetical protein
MHTSAKATCEQQSHASLTCILLWTAESCKPDMHAAVNSRVLQA